MQLSEFSQLPHFQRVAVMVDQTPTPLGAFLGHDMVYLDTKKPGPTK